MPFNLYAIVVNNLFFEYIFFEPVFNKTKAPVPYVLFKEPGSKQHWPIVAACWSPTTPLIGIDFPVIDGCDEP